MTTGKKEYTIVVNGVEQSIKEVTKLRDVVASLGNTFDKANLSVAASTRTAHEHSKTLSDEGKAEQKLIDTIDKVVRARSDANKAQIEANIAAREAQREITREIQIRQQAEGSIKQMGMQLSDLRNRYENLSGAERNDIAVGGELLAQIQALDAEYKALRESTGNFRDSVGNYEKALSGLGKLSDGVEGVTKSSMGLAQSLLGVNALMNLFGNSANENAESVQKLQKVIALLSIAQQVNENILRSGIVQNKLAIVTDTIRTAQLKAKTAAEAASTKGTISAAAAQKVLNAVASANPYVILALALLGVGSALAAFASGSSKAKVEQAKLNFEISTTNRLLKQLNRDTELAASLAEAEGKAEEEVLNIYRKAAKERTKLAEKAYDDITANTNATKEQIEEVTRLKQEAYDNEQALNDRASVLETKRRKEAADKAKTLAKERVKVEIEAVRAAEDAKIKLIQDANERAIKQTETTYNRQIEALRKRLSTETNLTLEARQALNEQIVSLEALKNLELQKLQEEQAEKTLELERQVEDSRTALIAGENDRRKAEIMLQYDRQIEDYKKRLDKEKSLTEEQQQAIKTLIENAQQARDRELLKLAADELKTRADLELAAIEDMLLSAERKIGEMTVRDKASGLIDADATRKNLEDTNKALDEYIKRLTEYQANLTATHKAALSTLEEGSTEYEDELQNYSRAMGDTTERIKAAQKEQEVNTKQSARAQLDALAELFTKISEYANETVKGVSAVMETWSMGLQVQLDDLNEQLDAINERYEEAQKQREDAVKNVEDIEAQLQEATGGTAEALKMQLQDAIHAREDAAREEKRLAKEKEKLEADIAKKEKQQKRAELITSIAMAKADVAAAVAKALTAGPVIGQIMAGIVAAAGAIQIGIMTKQLTKLAKGGEIKGPSHANGGVPILVNGEYTHEAQGGEFMVNDKSYSANKALVNFINDTPRALTVADLFNIVPGDSDTPVIVSDVARSEGDRIVEAIAGISIKPVVAVTDIMDATDEVVTVRDLAGF